MQKLLIQTFSAHKFSGKDDIPFPIEDYSAMKHGCRSAATKFGVELADKFFHSHFNQTLLRRQLLVLGSAYSFVRCAASMIMDSFIDRMNVLLANHGGERVERSIINRSLPYISDYGKLDQAGRAELLKHDSFSFDADFARGKLLIFLDDVVITGQHQVKLEEMLDRYQIPHVDAVCLYYAQLQANSQVHPDIESYLNSASITTLKQLQVLMMGEHEIVVRQLKMLLSWDNYDDLDQFLSVLPKSTIRAIYHSCLGEGYHKRHAYQLNFAMLANAARLKGTEYPIAYEETII